MNGNKTEYQELIIGRIRQIRVENNISQNKLAQILNISVGQVGNIESPRYPHKYTLKQIFEICDYLNHSIIDVFDEKHTNDTLVIIKKIIEYEG